MTDQLTADDILGPPPKRSRLGGRKPLYRDYFAEEARRLCDRFGATDADLSYFFGVSPKTIDVWKVKHPEFGAACVIGKEVADDRVERSFYQKCVGFHIASEKIFMPAGADEPVRAKTREYFPPDANAAMFWLKNRRPDRWRERKEIGLGGEKPGSPLTVHQIPASMTDADIAYIAELG